MAKVFYQNFFHLFLKVHDLHIDWNLIFPHQRKFSNFSLKGSNNLIRCPFSDSLQAFEGFRIPLLYCLGTLCDGHHQGLHRRRGTDIFDGNEFFKEFLLRFEIKADEKRLRLSFGLMVIDIESDHLSILPSSLWAEGLPNNGRKEDLIPYPIRQDNNPILFLLEQLPFDITYHLFPAL